MYPHGFSVANKLVQVNCSKCNTLGTWVDHGPTVGKGWFCRFCKDDIKHSDNVYGLTASKNVKEQVQPTLQAPSGLKYTRLNCVKVSCKTCNGAGFNAPRVDIQPGHFVVPVDDKGVSKHINKRTTYPVVMINLIKGTIHIRVPILGGASELREYSRCRFSKVTT